MPEEKLFLFVFTRFKYETYECDKNPTRLKKIFIKNYEVGEIVEVEFENEGFELKIIENTDFLMNLKRSNPKIEIKIDKKKINNGKIGSITLKLAQMYSKSCMNG